MVSIVHIVHVGVVNDLLKLCLLIVFITLIFGFKTKAYTWQEKRSWKWVL